VLTFTFPVHDACGLTSVRSHLDYYRAFACFRMGSILQGVYKRSLSGQASAADGAAGTSSHQSWLSFSPCASVVAQLLAVYAEAAGRGVVAEMEPLLMMRPPWGV